SQGSPPTEKLVAFFSGPVELDANGKARIDFDIPQFNGTARVMAVAWTKEAVGHAQTDVIVRDPVVITAGLPRFLAPGDAATMRLDIADTDGPAGDYKLSVTTTGDLSTGDKPLPEKLTLSQGKRQALSFPLIAQTAGDASITVKLAHNGGTEVEQTLYLPVRPAQLPVTNRMVVDLKPNGGALRVDKELLAASVLDGASVSIGVSQAAAFDVPSLLMTLDRYPYGCAEQTTSRALPLLYVNDMAKSIGMESDPDLHGRIQDAVYKVLSYQASSGSFGLWGPGSGDLWLDAYVTEFLTRAREQKYDVPAQAMNQALNNLQNSLGYDQDVQDRGSEIAYALYVLARNKKASIGDLRYYSDTQLESFSSPMAVAQLAASLALYGDTQRSEATFQTALRLAQASTEYDYYRSDYGSPLRDGAAMLALAAESKPVPSIVPQLIRLVARERADARWTSTQDESWMLLAARALKEGNNSITLSVNGAPHTGGYSDRVAGNDLVDSPLAIANTGTTALQAVV
ncbi:alpha-2-macroglobulin family protein, partial [Mesorhizobium sp.]